MTIRLHAATRLHSSTWWDSLSPEQKKGYIEEHPESKYAKDAKAQGEPNNTSHNTSPKTGIFKMKPLSEALKKAFSKAPKADVKFYEEGGAQPSSPQRKKAATLVKNKTLGILDHLKNQGTTWKSGFNAVRKLTSKQPLTDKDKHALQECAKDVVYAVTATALTGGLAGGLAAALSTLGIAMFEDIAIKAWSHSVVTASDVSTEDKFYASIITQLADIMESKDIPDEDLASSIEQEAQ